MTKAVCMNCGELKFGAFVECPRCEFMPKTLFDLTMSEMYSDHHANDGALKKLVADIKNNQGVAKDREGTLKLDSSIYLLLEERLVDQTFRDILTLVRRAKDGILKKELNLHLIGPDGYQSLVKVRGKDLDKAVFDKIRSEGDGNLYMSYHYERGDLKMTTVSKQKWYILFDKMQIIERKARGQSAYLDLLDGIFEVLLDDYLKHGTIMSSSNSGEAPSRSTDKADRRSESVPTDRRATQFENTHQLIVSSLSEGQEKFAQEIEALSDHEAKEAYGALVSIVHQMTRMKSGLGIPVALDDIEVFAKSFEIYVNRLDEIDSEDLQVDYETVRRGIAAADAQPNLRHGAEAFMVIILGEMIRRAGVSEGKHEMSGYECAYRMLNRLERSLDGG